MKNLLPLVFFSILCTVYVVRCQDNFGQVYCGRRLASALALLCEDAPQTVLLKRSGARSWMHGAWPLLPAQRARSLARAKRQVVAECCEKPCTIDELFSYC
ncbi:Bombyxin A-3-like [Papilio xuthus]|uniref:Bombyxin A-3-like n=1 Tax=Papilio xuthus TaxID=66420 RepID=A0A194PZA6_PAPXU|nr:Bombyxin A-3-like [Papilio xuthus]